jgi:hypothetical protein
VKYKLEPGNEIDNELELLVPVESDVMHISPSFDNPIVVLLFTYKLEEEVEVNCGVILTKAGVFDIDPNRR